MIIVTGGTGMLGGHILYHLTKNYDKITALRRKNSDIQKTLKIFTYYSETPEKNFKKIEWKECDIQDPVCLQDIIQEGDTVIHSAALVSFLKKNKKLIQDINVEGTSAVVNACLNKNVHKLCHVSSIAALSKNGNNSVIDETAGEINKNSSEYSKSKFHGELDVWRGISEGLNAVIVNPSVILGPSDWETGSSSLFSAVYKGINYYSEGITGFVDVNDTAKVIIRLIESDIKGERFIINSENISYKKLFETIALYLNVSPPQKKASIQLLKFAAFAESLLSVFRASHPRLTKETVRAAFSRTKYSNSKIKKAINYEFMSVEESVKQNSLLFMRDK